MRCSGECAASAAHMVSGRVTYARYDRLVHEEIDVDTRVRAAEPLRIIAGTSVRLPPDPFEAAA